MKVIVIARGNFTYHIIGTLLQFVLLCTDRKLFVADVMDYRENRFDTLTHMAPYLKYEKSISKDLISIISKK